MSKDAWRAPSALPPWAGVSGAPSASRGRCAATEKAAGPGRLTLAFGEHCATPSNRRRPPGPAVQDTAPPSRAGPSGGTESGGNGAFFPFIFPSVLALGVHESSLGPSHAFGETLSPALRGNDDVCQDPRYYYGVITMPQESTQTVATCSRPRGLRHQLPPLQRKPRKEKSQACGGGGGGACPRKSSYGH